MPAVRIQVAGLVQGVGFRYACRRQAQALGLVGWVRNCADGSVELFAEGSVAALAAMEAWCRQGPAGARVERVSAKPAPEAGYATFDIAP